MTPSEELLSAYLDNELDGFERADVERRLATDPSWRETLEKLKEVRAWMRELPAMVPNQPKSIVAMLAAQKYEPSDVVIQASTAPQFNAGTSSKRWMMTLAAASVVLLGTTLWWISRDTLNIIALSPAPKSGAPISGAPAAPTSRAPAQRDVNPQFAPDEKLGRDFGANPPPSMSKSTAKTAESTGDASDSGEASGFATDSNVGSDFVNPREMVVGSEMAKEPNRSLGRGKNDTENGAGGIGGVGGGSLAQPRDKPATAAAALPDPGSASEPVNSAAAGLGAAMPAPAPAEIESIAADGNDSDGSGVSTGQPSKEAFGPPGMRGGGKSEEIASSEMQLEREPADGDVASAVEAPAVRNSSDPRARALAFNVEELLPINRMLSESTVPQLNFYALTPFATSSATRSDSFTLSENAAKDQNKKSSEAGLPNAVGPETAATTIVGEVVHLRVPREAFADLQQAIVDGSIAMRDVKLSKQSPPDTAELLGRSLSLPGTESASEKEMTSALNSEETGTDKPIWLLEISAESYENLRKRWSERGFDISEILDEEKLGLKLVPKSEEMQGLTLNSSDSSGGLHGSQGERPGIKQTQRSGADEAVEVPSKSIFILLQGR